MNLSAILGLGFIGLSGLIFWLMRPKDLLADLGCVSRGNLDHHMLENSKRKDLQ